MSQDELSDDMTRPIRSAPPVYRSAKSEESPDPFRPTRNPPVFDPLENDETVMVDFASQEIPKRESEPSDVAAPTVRQDALATRSAISLDVPPNTAWTPPKRPSPPGVDPLAIRKQRSWLWPIALVAFISLAIFLVLTWQLSGS